MEFLEFQNSYIYLACCIIAGIVLYVSGKKNSSGGIALDQAIALTNKNSAVFIDLREEAERAAGFIPASRHLPIAKLEKKLESLSKKTAILIGSNEQVKEAAALLKSGQVECQVLKGGIQAWADAGFPLKKLS